MVLLVEFDKKNPKRKILINADHIISVRNLDNGGGSRIKMSTPKNDIITVEQDAKEVQQRVNQMSAKQKSK